MEDIRFQPRWNTKAVAISAQMKEVTIRKYCALLEAAGYTFTRINDRGDRRFSDIEIEMIIDMRRLSEESDMDVKQIAEILAKQYSKPSFISEDTHVDQTRSNELREIVESAGRQFGSIAKEEMRETVREEIKSELESQMNDLKIHITEELLEIRKEVAASRELPKRPWWRFRK
ncbi:MULTISPECIES: hypothetical protein [Alicyclobacillus]|uniref:Uncharacterized protein n=1 Tax=Alicyclobacillus acidoterrestris (strain ATCC 49025 / DSM 3922 / CIP 106132 / NCIMB 13137 / GD3B) TaxID=1356854 RepID=T0BTI9_ALIAG|nr:MULTISPECIES: hypothetical protein [Alicyclobacillus]EPZ43785.1 hypothetical protein N007_12085 [Alicyclobacillus acidoterrestris ATCC 49025]UNO51088.1 hypothetical protein K1I37_21160 [Alicyclobacillus acidoterrestris]GEO27553.1 hypothetical protein AAC03nite_33380 [Alicyclobacillus acidoterrestris]